MSRIITLFNQCGGVGKSTLTMNLGYALANRSHRVLLVDLDPQASLTTFMGLEPTELKATIYNSLLEDWKLPILTSIHKMDLVPTNINLSVAELELISALNRESRLKNALNPVTFEYEYILVDCPPSLGLLSILGLTAATHLLVPIETEFKSYFGTGLLLDTVQRVKTHVNQNLKIAGFVPMKFDKRRSQHTRTLEQIHRELSPLGTIFPAVPDSTLFSDATEVRKPLACYKSKHPGIQVLSEIAIGLEKL
ncbi:MAG: ParA family protein [Prochloraceae cyanobacterium]|nr:ParA family protein [Prochloraceae cyanobacterium]